LISADDVNLRMLAQPRRITMRYEDLTAADDGNQDKAAISDVSLGIWAAAWQMPLKTSMLTTFSTRRGDPWEGNLVAQTDQEWIWGRRGEW